MKQLVDYDAVMDSILEFLAGEANNNFQLIREEEGNWAAGFTDWVRDKTYGIMDAATILDDNREEIYNQTLEKSS